MRKSVFLFQSRVIGLPLAILGLVLIWGMSAQAVAQTAGPFNEVNGMLVIEAENFHSKSNTSVRDWYIFPTASPTPTPDPDPPRDPSGVGNGKYVELLPDTRVTHDDLLIYGENFWLSGDNAPRMNYRVKINSAGRYYIRARALSTGTEDNGVHFGVNNQWPTSASAAQWCGDWGVWKWSGNRRTDSNHCGIANTLYLDLTAGEHTIMVGGREDGFEMDRFILTKNSNFFPSGIGPPENPRINLAPVVDAGLDQIIAIDQTATLNGSVYDDGLPDGEIIIQWTMISGPGTAFFADPSNLITLVSFDEPGDYLLELSAHDGEFESVDDVQITVTEEPVAFAVFSPANVIEGDEVTLDGSGSMPGGAGVPIRDFWWEQLEGDPVTLVDADSPIASFTAGKAGHHAFQLTVTAADDQYASTIVEIPVSALNDPVPNLTLDPTPTPAAGSGNTGCFINTMN